MADTKISDYAALTVPADTDLIATAQENVSNKKLTWANLRLQAPWMTNYSRSKFTWVGTNTITIGPGAYYLYGKGWCYWTSNITFVLGSDGSNAGSSNLTASEWHIIAIDYSSVSTAGVLTAANFINRAASAVTPAYDGAKGGVYQDIDDRVIFAVKTNGSSQVMESWQIGDLVLNSAVTIDMNSLDIDTTYTDVTLASLPPFCTKGFEVIQLRYVDGGANTYWRVNGSTAGGLWVAGVSSSATRQSTTFPVRTDANHIIEVKNDTANGDTITMYGVGWYLEEGM